MLSIVIPAFNESDRLPKYLSEIRDYAVRLPAYEVVVVDDRSTDGMSKRLSESFGEWPELRVVAHPRNRGKGAAIRTGILAARGDPILVADADGAAPIENEARLRQAIDQGAALACGSRRARGDDVERTRRPVRGLAGTIFNFATGLVLRTDVKDTQCGFKMFRRHVARHLATLSVETGFALDVELLALAHELAYPTAEVAISWHEVPGGGVRLLRDGTAMLVALGRIRRRLRELHRRGELTPASRNVLAIECPCPTASRVSSSS
jgi:dolichyl-phosphate beta-glucosyltransferase